MIKSVNKFNKGYKGFSLVESLIGVFIAGTVFITFLAILPKMLASESMARKTIIATNLAQEGIEKIRNLRDNNLKTDGCDAFTWYKTSPQNDCHFPGVGIIREGGGAGGGVKILSTDDKMVGFTRVIKVEYLPDNCSADDPDCRRLITSTVSWNMAGQTKTVAIKDELSAWGQK